MSGTLANTLKFYSQPENMLMHASPKNVGPDMIATLISG